jgi:general secretion pathway protein K
VEWRQPTVASQLNTREPPRSENIVGPRRAPFQSVDEVLLVPGMTTMLFKQIKPALTVYSGRQFVDTRIAPPETLLALAAMSSDRSESQVFARISQRSPSIAPERESPISLRGRAFTVRSEFQRSDAAVVREATVRLTDNPDQPFWILSWRTQ